MAGGCALGGALMADNIVLNDGARLTGTVRSINEEGIVELTSELSPQPVKLKTASIGKIEFVSKDERPKPPGTLVELRNGDILHVTLEALDERILTAVSPEAGRLEIPRSALKCLQLGVLPHRTIYSGPRNLAEWTGTEGDAKNWSFNNNRLMATGPAKASAMVDLPSQFILRFTLKWQPRQSPNFQVFFADPLKPLGDPCDRYYLQFGAAGLEIKREAANGKHYNTLVQLNRSPEQYPDQQLKVELRVDRKSARLQLLLNDEPEGEFVDPIPAVPEGAGITLVFNNPNSPLEIFNIEVLESDDSRDRHRSEIQGDAKIGSLISREDDRWSGNLIEIRKTAQGPLLRFKNEFQEDLLEIPAADVSTVFFATPNEKNPDPASQPLLLRLAGEGKLHVSSCLFRDDTVSATHPLLGPMTFLRQGIVAMERADDKPKTKVTPNP
jgi:hypothetical protein